MKLKDIFKNHRQTSICKPYIIAEAGVNHEGSMDLAKRLIDEAKEGGAHAIKFQTYKANTLASKNSPSYWDLNEESTTSQYELFKKYDSFWKNEYENLKNYCDKVDIEFMSTPFDKESAIFLNDMMDVFKISSSDLNNLPFVEFMCDFNKPIILSTGAAHLWEIKRTVELINKKGNGLSLMHCILNYPTRNENANLGMLLDIKKNFPETILGYSDHTLPENMDSLITATLLGSVILEKHFTFDKTLPGNDHYHSMDKEDLKVFTDRINRTFELVGSLNKFPLETEGISRQNARRSLVALTNMKKGDKIQAENITWKRPGTGITADNYDELLGKTAIIDIEEDTVLQWNMFS